jgi:hypothetical protein
LSFNRGVIISHGWRRTNGGRIISTGKPLNSRKNTNLKEGRSSMAFRPTEPLLMKTCAVIFQEIMVGISSDGPEIYKQNENFCKG